jgi:hypothetical protein
MMPATITTPSSLAFPPQVIQPVVQIKPTWVSYWMSTGQLIATDLSTASAGQDLSRLVFHRRYGYVRDTYQPAFTSRFPLDLTDWWVRVQVPVAGAPDMQTVWLGRISGDDTTMYASSAVPAGVQQWVAYGPGQILRKRAVGKSYHDRDGVAQDIGWVPPLNDPTGSELGNRSDNQIDGSFLYGGEMVWNYYQYVKYLIVRFLDESATGGPEWTLAGQAQALYFLQDPIRWGTTQTVYQMLRRLIPLNRGLDYTIRTIGSRTPSQGPNIPEAGFEIFVYATQKDSVTFAGFTLPANPLIIPLDAGTATDLSPPPNVVTSYDRKYKRIRALGKRIVVCCSLWAAKAPDKAQVATSGLPGVPVYVSGAAATLPTLVKKWGDAIQAEYDTSSGNNEADADTYRRQAKFRDVYSSLGAPANWDMYFPWVDDVGDLRVDEPIISGLFVGRCRGFR